MILMALTSPTMRLAKANNRAVASMPEGLADATAMKHAPVKAVTPTGDEVETVTVFGTQAHDRQGLSRELRNLKNRRPRPPALPGGSRADFQVDSRSLAALETAEALGRTEYAIEHRPDAVIDIRVQFFKMIFAVSLCDKTADI